MQDDDGRWPLPPEHPNALTDAIGRIAIASAYLEFALRSAINGLRFGHMKMIGQDKRLKRLIDELDMTLVTRPFPDRGLIDSEWPALRSELRRAMSLRDHVIHSVWHLQEDGKMIAWRENNKPTKRQRPFTLEQVRRLAIDLKNAAHDVGWLEWNVLAPETGMPEREKRSGDVF
ncbi:MAG: hypothetical protein ACRDT0_10575 [Pseudonocardiaceae bacterium]